MLGGGGNIWLKLLLRTLDKGGGGGSNPEVESGCYCLIVISDLLILTSVFGEVGIL